MYIRPALPIAYGMSRRLSRLSIIISPTHYNPDIVAIVIGRAYLKRARARDVACHGAVSERIPRPPSAPRNVNGAVRERGVTENARERRTRSRW